ncbi:SRPBCC family protein [Terrimonas sp. NA20]|uniref:SRPBCC family protein n=1 Tax=Terrimonas ginsenosidimutans TaxID=2908004 RepID=A0ABS9KUH0_9BACT|nr:SRPBCC family protein [Terrimonas ginsenosidimutans]MCG2615925.1 SRPBCC family protein [Terrimonas ginsenosidimutans]
MISSYAIPMIFPFFVAAMPAIKFTESIIVKRSAAEVFDFTQDYNQRLSWDTFLKQADLMGGVTSAGKGVKAWCVAKNGLGMETEYITFNPPKATAVRMTKGPFLFKKFLGSWNFKEVDGQTTEVIFLYSYDLRFPFSIFSFLVKGNLQKNVRQRLNDLKKCLEG